MFIIALFKRTQSRCTCHQIFRQRCDFVEITLLAIVQIVGIDMSAMSRRKFGDARRNGRTKNSLVVKKKGGSDSVTDDEVTNHSVISQTAFRTETRKRTILSDKSDMSIRLSMLSI